VKPAQHIFEVVEEALVKQGFSLHGLEDLVGYPVQCKGGKLDLVNTQELSH
jgi:hypothetical protein